jgi:hypothetical protein
MATASSGVTLVVTPMPFTPETVSVLFATLTVIPLSSPPISAPASRPAMRGVDTAPCLASCDPWVTNGLVTTVPPVGGVAAPSLPV